MTERLDERKSMILRPSGSSTKASRIAHSFGTSQSSTCVPVGTSRRSSGMCWPSMRSVSRTPSPVMLRQIGKISLASSKISAPVAAVGASGASSRRGRNPAGVTSVDRHHAVGHAPGSFGAPQVALQYARLHQMADMGDALEVRPFEVLDAHARRTYGVIELLRAGTRVPARLRLGQDARQL